LPAILTASATSVQQLAECGQNKINKRRRKGIAFELASNWL